MSGFEDALPEKYRKDEEFIRQTIEQLKKDFGPLLLELVFSNDPSALFDELAEQVMSALQSIKNSTTLQTLLYRVDLTESQLKKAHQTASFFRVLAEKVIQREFQKVLTRNYFSKNT